ncbi:DinB/UmuC family translesion DNA polymerase [Streptomyces bacillaris]|uniref:DinB/UmuC family translesion DNA polymerase n=1 Tax=Streptomyces bacillaris TaxID=68179 RepID=UPI003F4D1E75
MPARPGIRAAHLDIRKLPITFCNIDIRTSIRKPSSRTQHRRHRYTLRPSRAWQEQHDPNLGRDELDPDLHHATLLGLVQELRARLRTGGEIAQALTLTYADRTQTSRTRALAEPSAHTPALAAVARQLLTGLGLQRARVRTIALRAERLQPAGRPSTLCPPPSGMFPGFLMSTWTSSPGRSRS